MVSCVAIKKPYNPYRTWVYQLQNVSPVQLSKLEADIVVIDYSCDGSDEGRYSRKDIEGIKTAGSVVISYLNIGQAENYRFYWKDDWNSSPPDWIITEDPEWKGDYYIRYWEWNWKEIMFSYIDKILEEGFNGIYMDRVDAFEYMAKHGIMSEEEAAKKMIDLIEEISDYIKSKKNDAIVVLQNGERILMYGSKELLEKIDGWAVEDLFYSYRDFDLKPQDAIEEREKYLKVAQKAGKFILVVEYIDDGEENESTEERIKEFIRMCESRAYTPYATFFDRKLDKIDYRFFQIYFSHESENK